MKQYPIVLLIVTLFANASNDNTNIVKIDAKQKNSIDNIVKQQMKTNFSAEKQINLAGKQRMLSQKITEIVVLLYLNIDAKENTKRLISATNEFADSLTKLKKSSQNDKNVLTKIVALENEWNHYISNIKKLLFKGNKTQEGLKYVVSNDEKLLNMSDDLVKSYKESHHASIYLDKYRTAVIDIAGRERMLTIKMLKEKLLLLSGEKSMAAKLEKTSKLFESSLEALMHGNKELAVVAPKNKEMINKLNQIRVNWQKLKPALKQDKFSDKELQVMLDEFHTQLLECDNAVKISTNVTEY